MRKTLIIERINVRDIVVDERFQPRTKLSENRIREYCKRYKTNPENMPPIIVYRIGGVLYVISGFHRLRAAIEAGLKTIEAVIKDGTEAEAIWEALGSNQHGLSLNGGDKKRAVIMALDAMPDQSDGMIASQIGCSCSLVCKTRKKLVEIGRLVEVETVVGKDGKVQTRRRKCKSKDGSAQKIEAVSVKSLLDVKQVVEQLLQLLEHEAYPSAFLIKVLKGLYEGLRDQQQQKLFAMKSQSYLKRCLEKERNIMETSDEQ